jgi:Gluconate 2-dehydrogenase subunit 3
LNRRDAIQRVAVMMGGALSAPTMIALLEGCKSSTDAASEAKFALKTDYQSLVAEIAEIIIPKTTTAGAKEAGVGPFIEKMLADCYTSAQQKHFLAGLETVEAEAQKANGKKFLECTKEQQIALLKQSEQAAKDEASKNEAEAKKITDTETGLTKEAGKKKDSPPTPFFKLAKELTLFGYFTSEKGATESLAYLAVPGRYEGCVKLTPGQKAWAI